MLAVLNIASFSLLAQQDSLVQKLQTVKSQVERYEYVCTMKCEGDRTYDKPGNCPKCGMQLVEKSKDSNSHNMKMMHPMMMGGMHGSNHKKIIPLTIIMGAMMIVVMFISKSR